MGGERDRTTGSSSAVGNNANFLDNLFLDLSLDFVFSCAVVVDDDDDDDTEEVLVAVFVFFVVALEAVIEPFTARMDLAILRRLPSLMTAPYRCSDGRKKDCTEGITTMKCSAIKAIEIIICDDLVRGKNGRRDRSITYCLCGFESPNLQRLRLP